MDLWADRFFAVCVVGVHQDGTKERVGLTIPLVYVVLFFVLRYRFVIEIQGVVGIPPKMDRRH